MKIKRYSVRYWSSIDWGWSNFEVLAESKEQVRELVENLCSKEYRLNGYGQDTESLEIKKIGTVEFPYLVQ